MLTKAVGADLMFSMPLPGVGVACLGPAAHGPAGEAVPASVIGYWVPKAAENTVEPLLRRRMAAAGMSQQCHQESLYHLLFQFHTNR